jgi:glycosyltransferase involved in cell wall biosynthesis
MSQPLVSVLMTCYNAERYVAAAIDSLLAQTHTHWELLLADDCSTDATREIIARYTDPRIRVFHNEHNLHYLRTRNKLVQYVKGEFIALLDADDLYIPTKLEQQLKAFAYDPELALCGTLVGYINREGNILSTKDYKPQTHNEIQEAIKVKNVFTGSAIMVKTSVWHKIGGYRDFFNTLGYEDYDLTSRIVEHYKSRNLHEVLYLYRQYPESTSRRDMLYNPFKLNGHLLIQHFIQQRSTLGYDSLDRNDIPAIINFVMRRNRPYVDDPSLIHREAMWGYLHTKMYRLAYRHCVKAIIVDPFAWTNYRTAILLILISCGIRKN